MVVSILTCSLLVGGALEWGSSGIVANQAGKSARWTAGKSKDIIPHISSASLGAHQGDRLRFFRGALPIDRCSLPQCVGCKKKTNNNKKTNKSFDWQSGFAAWSWPNVKCKALQIYNQLNKYRTLSQTKCLQCTGCLRHHKKKKKSGCRFAPTDSLIRFQPLIQLPLVWQTFLLPPAAARKRAMTDALFRNRERKKKKKRIYEEWCTNINLPGTSF